MQKCTLNLKKKSEKEMYSYGSSQGSERVFDSGYGVWYGFKGVAEVGNHKVLALSYTIIIS